MQTALESLFITLLKIDLGMVSLQHMKKIPCYRFNKVHSCLIQTSPIPDIL